MEELIFFAVIIFFSIVESIARSRRAKRGGEAPEEGGAERAGRPERAEREVETRRRTLPTYDEDPPYDDEPSYDDQAVRAGRHRGGVLTHSDRPSSEEMLPGELLEELARMAGRVEQRRARTLELPKESPPIPDRGAPDRAPGRRTKRTADRPVRTPEHPIHRAHANYGTDPSSRPPSFHDRLDPLAEVFDADASAVHAQLRSLDPDTLQRAIVLREVLGKPLALREE